MKKICVRQFYFTSKSWRQIWWCVKQSFKYILFINVFIHKVWEKLYYACVPFLYTDVEHNLFFLALFKPIILQFFTILQDKLHSLNIQDDLSTRFLWAKNYRLGQPHYKTFSWREFSIIPELFCRNSLLLCDMQGNNYGLSVKTIKKS